MTDNTWARTRGAQLSAGYTLPTPIDRRLVFPTRWFCAAAAAAAAENQHVGKTRRRSIYSADKHATDRHDLPPTNQPAKVTVPS